MYDHGHLDGAARHDIHRPHSASALVEGDERVDLHLSGPSGTEPVLRVYAEGRNMEMVKALMAYGKTVAESVV